MNTAANPVSPQQAPPSPPWWKFGHVWLIVSGPAIVVVASFVTLYLAITIPDPVVSEDYYRQGLEINKSLADVRQNQVPPNMAPALTARNHAATGVVVKPEVATKP